MVEFRNMSVVLCLLLSMESGDATSTLGRKRITLDTAFAQTKDSFGLERNLRNKDYYFGDFGPIFLSMSMSMCMSMDMGMKGDKVIYYDKDGVEIPRTSTLVAGTVNIPGDKDIDVVDSAGGTDSTEGDGTGGTDNGVVDSTGDTGNAGGDSTGGTDNGVVDSTGDTSDAGGDSTGGTDNGIVDSTGDTSDAGGDSTGGTNNGMVDSTGGFDIAPDDGTTRNPSGGAAETASSTPVISDSGTTTDTSGSSGTTDSTTFTLVATAESRYCSSESSSFTFDQPSEYHREIIVPFSYKVETSFSHGRAVKGDLEKVDNAVLDVLAQNLLSCDGSSSERMLMVQRLLDENLRVSSIRAHSDFDGETCETTDKNSEYCAVVEGTIDLSVDDSSLSADDLTEATLSMIKDGMYPSNSLSSSIEGVTKLTYVPIVHEVTIDATSGSGESDGSPSSSGAGETGAPSGSSGAGETGVSSGSSGAGENDTSSGSSGAGESHVSSGAGESDTSSGTDENNVSSGADKSDTSSGADEDNMDLNNRDHGDLGTFGADAEAKGDNNNRSSGSGGVIAGVLVVGACAAVIVGILVARRRRNASQSVEEISFVQSRDLESQPDESNDEVVII